jgi:hypothetical protein
MSKARRARPCRRPIVVPTRCRYREALMHTCRAPDPISLPEAFYSSSFHFVRCGLHSGPACADAYAVLRMGLRPLSRLGAPAALVSPTRSGMADREGSKFPRVWHGGATLLPGVRIAEKKSFEGGNAPRHRVSLRVGGQRAHGRSDAWCIPSKVRS